MGNKHLNKAKETKDDEFYTLYDFAATELDHYKPYIHGRVLLPCNDCGSAFQKYFLEHYDELGLTSLIAVHYGEDAYYEDEKLVRHPLRGDGSFDSEEVTALAADCDFIFTNPPFSILRARFFPWLVKTGKKFAIVTPLGITTYKDVTDAFFRGEVWSGAYQKTNASFGRPDGSIQDVPCMWLQNIVRFEREPIQSDATYDPALYPKYRDADVISVKYLRKIPIDYDGLMAVPITVIAKEKNKIVRVNESEYEIVGVVDHSNHSGFFVCDPFLEDGTATYDRFIIQRR